MKPLLLLVLILLFINCNRESPIKNPIISFELEKVLLSEMKLSDSIAKAEFGTELNIYTLSFSKRDSICSIFICPFENYYFPENISGHFNFKDKIIIVYNAENKCANDFLDCTRLLTKKRQNSKSLQLEKTYGLENLYIISNGKLIRIPKM